MSKPIISTHQEHSKSPFQVLSKESPHPISRIFNKSLEDLHLDRLNIRRSPNYSNNRLSPVSPLMMDSKEVPKK